MGTRQKRLAELREYALELLDRDKYSTLQIFNACGTYIDKNWGLGPTTRDDYLDWIKRELKDIFRQHEVHSLKKL